MKKNAIISYLLAFALLLSACVYRIPDNTQGSSAPALQESESTPTHSDTSPSSVFGNESTSPTESTYPTQPTYYQDWSDVTEPTFTEDEITYTENGIIAGPFTFEYIDTTYRFDSNDPDIALKGLNLVYCEVNSSKVVIPSTVCGLPVVAIAYGYHMQTMHDSSHFKQNTPLRALYIPDTVLYISIGALYDCTALSEVRLSNSIEYLGTSNSDACEDFFRGTAVKFVEVPEGVLELGHFTFSYSNVEYLILPSTLTHIWTASMNDCPLQDIYLRAEEAHYPESLLEEINEQTDATLYFYSEEEPTEEGNFWHYVDGKPVIW